jgi:hypothetical protein
MKTIYSNNLKDRIDSTFQSIDRFIDKVFEDNGQIPRDYQHPVTNLSRLNDITIEIITKV